MTRRLCTALFFAGTTPLWPLAAQSPTPPPVAAYADADELWQRIEALKSGPGRRFASPDEFKNYVTGMDAAAVEFARHYSDDVRRWEAKMIHVQADAVLQAMSGRKPSEAAQEKVYQEILAAADATIPVKMEARFGLLQVHLTSALEAQKLTPELEMEMAAFKKDFPRDPRVEAVELLRAKFLLKTAPAKGRALLQDLAGSKNPDVAAEAQALLK